MESLQLVHENVKKKNINLCIICQKNKSTEKLSSTDNGRKKLLTASKILNGITTASSRKREEEKYKLMHYMSEKQVNRKIK